MSVEQFGTLLRQYRLAAGLSQEVLAELALISADGISALERGVNRAPQRQTLERLIRALDLNPEQRRAIETASKRPSRPRIRGTATRHNLPAQRVLFGREHEIEAITSLLSDTEPVTLIGAGGVGKTSLAIEVGRRLLQRFHDGVWFVDLAALRDPALVPRAIATVLAVSESLDRPLIEGLADALSQKRLLLILDNCEHVVEAAASVIAVIRRKCPRVRVLATSRQPIGIAGERPYRVSSLAVDAAIALFEDRAQRAIQSFALTDENMASVTRICRRLDGIALAIELAAARLRVLSPQQLEDRLDERFRLLRTDAHVSLPRHKTMQALIDWSFDLLNAQEQAFFVCLGTFVATFSVDGARAVAADANIDEWAALELLTSLVDKSLVTSDLHGDVQRYRLLESMRTYALERAKPQYEILERKHANYYLSLAEGAEANIATAASSTVWAAQLDPELEDVRATLEWALGRNNDASLGVRLLIAMHKFWLERGLAAEVVRWAECALRAEAALPKPLQAALWLELAQMHGDLLLKPSAALDAAVHARTMFSALGDENGVARALRDEGIALLRTGFFEGSKRALEQALVLSRKHGAQSDVVRAVAALALYHQLRGELEEARKAHLETLEMARDTGDGRVQWIASLNLAESDFWLGDAASAAVRAYENLASDTLRNNRRLRANQASNLAVYLIALDAPDEARAVAFEALHDAYDAGDHGLVTITLQHIAALIVRREPRRAARLFGYIERAFGATGYKREYTEVKTYDIVVSALNEALGPDDIATLEGEGALLTEDQVLKLAQRK
jgi:predicted ATPase/DNA-binding XRE family transcriptional regulator